MESTEDCCVYMFTEMCLKDNIPDSAVEANGA